MAKHAKRRRTAKTDEERAADAKDGQRQEPIQAREDSSSVWDTTEHSDAPGPFGTGGE
jgi:hypothetical protein